MWRGSAKAGTPIILYRTSNTDKAEDFNVSFQGTVQDFFNAGLVSSALNLHYSHNWAFEFEYTPNGVGTGLCIGTASTAANGTPVVLVPCGASAKSVWVVDSRDSIGRGYVPLINGSDTNFSHPYVLHYPGNGHPTDTPRPQLNTWNAAEVLQRDRVRQRTVGRQHRRAAVIVYPRPAPALTRGPALACSGGEPGRTDPGDHLPSQMGTGVGQDSAGRDSAGRDRHRHAPAACPRCGRPLKEPTAWSSAWRCDWHGEVQPLLPAFSPSQDGLDGLLHMYRPGTAGVPVWLPWPLPLGWLVAGFAGAGDERTGVRACAVALTGPNPLGGPADMVVVAEEPGIGLGAALAGLDSVDPGAGLRLRSADRHRLVRQARLPALAGGFAGARRVRRRGEGAVAVGRAVAGHRGHLARGAARPA